MIIKKKQYNVVALLKTKLNSTLVVQYLMEFLRPINVIRLANDLYRSVNTHLFLFTIHYLLHKISSIFS